MGHYASEMGYGDTDADIIRKLLEDNQVTGNISQLEDLAIKILKETKGKIPSYREIHMKYGFEDAKDFL